MTDEIGSPLNESSASDVAAEAMTAQPGHPGASGRDTSADGRQAPPTETQPGRRILTPAVLAAALLLLASAIASFIFVLVRGGLSLP